MGMMFLLTIMFITLGIYSFLVVVLSVYAYCEGKDDATRYYGSYSNYYWMPMAFVYEYAYKKWDGRDRLTTKAKNKKRFNRE